MKRVIKNPILPGFYPDPSICKADDCFYLICSSFELHPGIPVFRSRDLAHWEQIGNVMTKENGFHVKANTFTGGVMAPTIRYYDGRFYIINTNFSDRGNYIVTAEDPAGPWSEPYWLDDVPGIDASLFIDEDGSAYILGTGNVVKRADGNMERGIWLCEFDLKAMKLTGEPTAIWDSALRNAASPEAPHLYHKDGYYYLVIAEGGTEHYHSVTVARSREIKGWYEGFPGNPVMTHRQMGYDCEIANVGHADLVETDSGNWYAVMLASRTIGGYYKNLGRETYICPVKWERGWPVFSPGTGKIEWEYEADPDLPWTEELMEEEQITDQLPANWCFWGTPYGDFWKVENGEVTLKCLPRRINEPLKCLLDESENGRKDDCVSFIGRRVTGIDYRFSCRMDFTPQENETAGLVLLQASDHQYRMEKSLKDGEEVLRVILSWSEMDVPPHFPNFKSETKEKVLAEIPAPSADAELCVEVEGQDFNFFYEEDGQRHPVYEHADGRLINPEIVGCMTGMMAGVFASANGKESGNRAVFSEMSYRDATV